MEHQFSQRTVNRIVVLCFAIAALTLALDWYGGFAYDHWRDTLMARF